MSKNDDPQLGCTAVVMPDLHRYAGWFVAYAYKLDGIGELCLGSTTWRITDSDKETPWQKVTRWNDEMEGRSFVLLSWRKLTEDEFFEHDLEA